ncbi:nucleotide pyrophosphohydrolase [Fodinisporobacter ferrooxydans]|uniref:Nucleotide pyrophosphohydrolase n=1 Tax=Fodinisporobacter ferrooxydans TaxID=2901836 RepID=A0ABY4CII4_9BACL|nr:nucleotide pyrophosphohydrolase [Alicyclobacillaceae bacterium MYW30-H2]
MQEPIIRLPRLNGLNPTLESTLIKLQEELGEVARVLGKYRGMSGEQPLDQAIVNRELAMELLDVAQTAATFMYVLSDQGVDLESVYQEHIEKLKGKGYIR